MRTFRAKIVPLAVLLLTIVVVPLWGLAQGGADCPGVATQTLQALGNVCNGLDRNSACYGSNEIKATFNQNVPADFFSKPGDHSPTIQIASLQTSPLDVANNQWGVALMNVQADVPDSLKGQGLNFILLGDASFENVVAPDDVLPPVTPITVTTHAASNLRSAPGTNTDVITSVGTGTQLSADSLSEGRNWLRVLYQDKTVWISRDAVDTTGDLNSLPAISVRNRAPMQAFRFSTQTNASPCSQAPSLLVIQGPNGAQANIRANGANITVDSTIVLQLLPGHLMQLAVLDGGANVGNLQIPHGFKVNAALSSDDSAVTGPWTHFAPLSDDDLNEYAVLAQIPASLLHYAITVPTRAEIQSLLAQFGGTSQGGQTGPAASGVDCKNFKLTAPLQGLPPGGKQTYSWAPAPGATSYRLDVANESGSQVGSYTANAPATSVSGDVGALGAGNYFTIEVTALVNGQTACTTSPVTVPRQAVCNQNNKCEPWLGENSANCSSDCTEGG